MMISFAFPFINSIIFATNAPGLVAIVDNSPSTYSAAFSGFASIASAFS
jgi:hypothetical protein